MGLLDRWLFGVDLDAEAKRTKELQEKQAKLDSADRMQAVWTPDDWLAHQQNMQREAEILTPETYNGQVYQAAAEGAKEGLAAEAKFTRDVVNTTAGRILPETIKTVIAFLPWWVWTAGAMYIAWRFGWLRVLAGFVGTKGIAWIKAK